MHSGFRAAAWPLFPLRSVGSRLDNYETYVAALETAYPHSIGAHWSGMAERWYHDLREALLCCVEQYRLRHSETCTTPGSK